MNDVSERALLLDGSPKGIERSNSARLGRLILDGLERNGWACESIRLHVAVESEERRRELLGAIDRANVVLFASPLYVDSIPAPAIRALELIGSHRRPGSVGTVPRFVSILICGFIEPSQNDTCQRILQRFADRTGFDWIGGVSLGGETGRMTRRIRRAFHLLIEAIDAEILVPDEVERLTRKPVMPRWLYILRGNIMWRRRADRSGTKDRLYARPYRRSDS